MLCLRGVARCGFDSHRLLKDDSPCPISDLGRDSDSFTPLVTFSKVESSDTKEMCDSREGVEDGPENSCLFVPVRFMVSTRSEHE